jgi:hypothetical protein
MRAIGVPFADFVHHDEIGVLDSTVDCGDARALQRLEVHAVLANPKGRLYARVSQDGRVAAEGANLKSEARAIGAA